MALYLYIKNNYPEISVKVYLDSPKPVFDHIDRIGEIHTEADGDQEFDLFVTCDVSARDRLAIVDRYFDTAKKTVCIDHHVSNTGFADVNYIKGDISSCCEVLYGLMDKDKVDQSVAAAVYKMCIRDRVNAIVEELRGEKIDIINWDENPAILIENALSPAKVIAVMADPDEKTALVVVPDYQLSLAIGKEGQNARLAARLTGFKIDIKSETQAKESGELYDYEEEEYSEEEMCIRDRNTGSIPVLAAESAIKRIGCTFSFVRKIKDTDVFLASTEKSI